MLGILNPGASRSDLRKAPWVSHRWIWGVGMTVWVMHLAQHHLLPDGRAFEFKYLVLPLVGKSDEV